MQQLADDILAIISDYQNDFGFHITSHRIIEWANQFDVQDREFVLKEFRHLLNQGIYLSKAKAKVQLRDRIEEMRVHYQYATTNLFLSETVFLDLQKENKSQKHILTLLDEVLIESYGIHLIDSGKSVQKNFVYFDDGINTGGTLFYQIKNWLLEDNRLTRVSSRSIRLTVSVFYYHTWAWENVKWRWKKEFENDQINNRVDLFYDYAIENHLGFNNQRFNLAYPVDGQPGDVSGFLNQLHEGAINHPSKACRPVNKPLKETFFSSIANRNKFETILLVKGIDILSQVTKANKQHRPLGDVSPSYKTYGTGTLFFTWRNISNTCPLVFWWEGHGWHSLFPLQGRG